MGEAAENLENIIDKYMPANDEFAKPSGITVVGDFHDNLLSLEVVLAYSQKRGNVLLYNGDIVGDYNIIDIGNKLGYKTQYEIIDEYAKDFFSEQDHMVYMHLQEIEQVGSYENYIRLINSQNNFSAEQLNAINAQLMQVMHYAQNDVFQQKLKKFNQGLEKDKSEDLQMSAMQYISLFEAMLVTQGKKFADLLNKYDVKTRFNNGNHDTIDFIEGYVKPHLEDPEKIIVLNDKIGYQEDNNITYVATTNSYKRIFGALRAVLDPRYIEQKFPHVENGIDEKVLMTGAKTRKEILDLEEIVRGDDDFNRMTNNGKDLESKVDMVTTHAPTTGQQAFSGSAAYLASDAQLTIASDTHVFEEGETSYGTKMINTGTKMVEVIKDENGVIQSKSYDLPLQRDETYIGHTNTSDDGLAELDDLSKQIFYQFTGTQMDDIVVANDENATDSKAA